MVGEESRKPYVLMGGSESRPWGGELQEGDEGFQREKNRAAAKRRSKVRETEAIITTEVSKKWSP